MFTTKITKTAATNRMTKQPTQRTMKLTTRTSMPAMLKQFTLPENLRSRDHLSLVPPNNSTPIRNLIASRAAREWKIHAAMRVSSAHNAAAAEASAEDVLCVTAVHRSATAAQAAADTRRSAVLS